MGSVTHHIAIQEAQAKIAFASGSKPSRFKKLIINQDSSSSEPILSTN